MKHEKISIKWRVFTYLLVFTGILLVVLWLIQICYLDSFYTMIKSREAEQVTSAVANILTSDEDDKDTLIHDIAAKNNMAVYVTNTDGDEICSAEYIVNSRLADMPSEQVQYYYEQAKEHGGIFKIEYEAGSIRNSGVKICRNQKMWQMDPDSTVLCRNADRNTSKV